MLYEVITEEFFTKQLTELPTEDDFVPEQTVGLQRVLQRTVAHMQAAGKKDVGLGDLLAAILEEENSHAAHFLGNQGIRRIDVLNYISHGVSKVPREAGSPRITSYNVCYTKLLRTSMSTNTRERIMGYVITSYSIHYTKLYECCARPCSRGAVGPIGRARGCSAVGLDLGLDASPGPSG